MMDIDTGSDDNGAEIAAEPVRSGTPKESPPPLLTSTCAPPPSPPFPAASRRSAAGSRRQLALPRRKVLSLTRRVWMVCRSRLGLSLAAESFGGVDRGMAGTSAGLPRQGSEEDVRTDPAPPPPSPLPPLHRSRCVTAVTPNPWLT